MKEEKKYSEAKFNRQAKNQIDTVFLCFISSSILLSIFLCMIILFQVKNDLFNIICVSLITTFLFSGFAVGFQAIHLSIQAHTAAMKELHK